MASASATATGSAAEDLWLAWQRALINATHNWDQNRSYNGSLLKRREGFTEHWGDGSSHCDSDSGDYPNDVAKKQRGASVWKRVDGDSVRDILASPYPQERITLFQYHPAWEEQLALRVAGVPYVAVNSQYAVTETTGPLPYLRHFYRNDRDSERSRASPPVLVGRRMTAAVTNPPTVSVARTSPTSASFLPSLLDNDNNAILNYIHDKVHNLNESLPKHERDKARMFQSYVTDTLEPCLTALRYCDRKAYQQVYREQSLTAATQSSASDGRHRSRDIGSLIGGRGYAASFVAGFQAHCERIHAQSRLTPSQRSLSTRQAVLRARNAYQLFEAQLRSVREKREQKGGGLAACNDALYLMETERPVVVDILLFGSLARALSDVHLVVVLADFPELCSFAQRIWDAYFDPSLKEDAATEWERWNAKENARNAFCSLPMVQHDQRHHEYRNAVELMERLSFQRHNLHEQLLLAKEVRSEQSRCLSPALSSPNRSYLTWYRWRMGGDYMPSKATAGGSRRHDASAAAAEQQQEKLKREYQRNDEIWMMTVAATTVVSFILFSGVSSGGLQ